MFLTTARLIIKYFFQNFFRNFWLSVVAITVMVASVLSLTSIFVMSGFAAFMVQDFSQKIDVSLYFPVTLSESQALEFKQEIEKLPETKSVELISSEQALKQFKDAHKDDEFVLSSLAELDGNPLGPILTVRAKTLEDYPALLESIGGLGISRAAQEVDYQDRIGIIDKLKILSARVQYAGIAFTIFFALIAALTVINTIRLGIYSHREEISIMKLVGATNGFIRAPYILEGIFYALLSIVISWVIILAAANGFSRQLDQFLSVGGFSVYGYLSINAPGLILSEFILLSFLNVLASAVALRKYLHV